MKRAARQAEAEREKRAKIIKRLRGVLDCRRTGNAPGPHPLDAIMGRHRLVVGTDGNPVPVAAYAYERRGGRKDECSAHCRRAYDAAVLVLGADEHKLDIGTAFTTVLPRYGEPDLRATITVVGVSLGGSYRRCATSTTIRLFARRRR